MYKKILVPIDLSEASSWEQSLPRAVELARQSRGSILVVTVLTDIQVLLKGATLPISYERLHAKNEKTLNTIVERNVSSDITAETIVGHGSIHREIVRIALDEQADLILMASHSPGIRDYFLGPNAAHVARHAHCSVLIIRGE